MEVEGEGGEPPLPWDKSFGLKAEKARSSELRSWCSHQRLYPSPVSHFLRVSRSPQFSQIPHASISILFQFSCLPSLSCSPILFGDRGPSSFLTSPTGIVYTISWVTGTSDRASNKSHILSFTQRILWAPTVHQALFQELKTFWRIKTNKNSQRHEVTVLSSLLAIPVFSENSSVGGELEHPSHPRVVPSGPRKSSQAVGTHSLQKSCLGNIYPWAWV